MFSLPPASTARFPNSNESGANARGGHVKDSDPKSDALANAQLLAVTFHTALRRGTGDRVSLPRFVAETALDAASKLVRYLEAE